MEYVKTLLTEPLTLNDIESYYENTKSDTMTVVLEMPTSELFIERSQFNKKLSNLVIGSNSIENELKFTITTNDNVLSIEGNVVVEVTFQIEDFITQIEFEKESRSALSDICNQILNKPQHNKEALSAYEVVIDTKRKVNNNNAGFILAVDDIINRSNVSLKLKDDILAVDKPLWLSFKNLSHNEIIDPLIRPDRNMMNNIVEFIGYDLKKELYYFRVHDTSNIATHQWHDILENKEVFPPSYLSSPSYLPEHFTFPTYLHKNTLPSLNKGTYSVKYRSLTEFEFTELKAPATSNTESQRVDRRYLNDVINDSPMESVKSKSVKKERGRIFKVKFTNKDGMYNAFYNSFINNLNRIVNRSDYFDNAFYLDAWVKVPNTVSDIRFLGFNGRNEPLFMTEYKELYLLKQLFVGGLHDTFKEGKTLASLLPEDSFELVDLYEF